MAVSVTGYINLNMQVTDNRTAVTGAFSEQGARNLALSAAWTVASGIAASAADRVWMDQRTVTTGATDAIDIATTSAVANSFGELLNIVKLRAILIYSLPTNTTTLTLTRPSSAGVPIFSAVSTSIAALSAGGFFCWADPGAGISVVATTADILNVVNSAGASAVYQIALIGTSA